MSTVSTKPNAAGQDIEVASGDRMLHAEARGRGAPVGPTTERPQTEPSASSAQTTKSAWQTAETVRAQTRTLRHQMDTWGASATLGGHRVSSSPMFMAVDGGLFPRADTVYSLKLSYQGEVHRVRFSVDAEVAAYFEERGHRINPQTGMLLRSDGTQNPLVGNDAQNPFVLPLAGIELLGDAPPQLQAVLCLATDVHFAAVERQADGSMNVSIQIRDYQTPLDTFRNRSDPAAPPTIDEAKGLLQPLAIRQSEMGRRVLVPGVEISAATSESLRVGMESVDRVLSHALADWPQRRSTLEARLERCRDLKERLFVAMEGRDPSRFDQVCASIARELSLFPQTDPHQLLGALTSESVNLECMLAPVEIVIVPQGKHWASMPQWQDASNKAASVPPESRGVCALVEMPEPDGGSTLKRLAFLPEDDAKTQRHELYHLLDDVFMPEIERTIIDQAYRSALQNGGPFARPYGAQRSEFLTTWAELYEGDQGARGCEFLAHRSPAVEGVLKRATQGTA
ncbi:MAG: hypothetical protein AAF219_03155 [Myxococcota bacterium]